MGCIYKRGRTWWGRFTLDGQEHRRSLGTIDKDRAESLLTEWMKETAATRAPGADRPPNWTSFAVLGDVYALGYGDRVKIGWSSIDPNWRREQMQRTYPETLVLFGFSPGYMRDEKALHAQFAAHRIRGEWFLREGGVAAWIEAGCPASFAHVTAEEV